MNKYDVYINKKDKQIYIQKDWIKYNVVQNIVM